MISRRQFLKSLGLAGAALAALAVGVKAKKPRYAWVCGPLVVTNGCQEGQAILYGQLVETTPIDGVCRVVNWAKSSERDKAESYSRSVEAMWPKHAAWGITFVSECVALSASCWPTPSGRSSTASPAKDDPIKSEFDRGLLRA